MPIHRCKPQRPFFAKHLITPQLMVDPRKHGPKLLRRNQPKDIPHSVGARFLGPDEALQPLGSMELRFDRIQTPPAGREHQEST